MSSGVGALLAGFFQRGHLKLTKTERPYYLRSLTLFYACRLMPEPPQENSSQLNDLKRLFTSVENAIEYGTSFFREDFEATRRFEEARKELSKYLTTYHVRFTEDKIQIIKGYAMCPGSWEDAGKQDRDAEASLNMLATALKKMIRELENIPTIVVPMQIWQDTPISVKNSSEFRFNSHLVELIRIEETAPLNMLLHRLLEYAALPDNRGHSPLNIQIHLIQYPQFYPVFPSSTTSFESAARHWDGRKIKSIEPWVNVKIIRKHRVLHLIMERKKQEREVKLQSGSQLPLSDIHKNVWPLEDSEDTVVVRNRTSSFSLSIWPPPMSDSGPSNISRSTSSEEGSGAYSSPSSTLTTMSAKCDMSYADLVKSSILNADDLVIVIVGLTGTGKSTIMDRVTGENKRAGRGLESCTKNVSGIRVKNHPEYKDRIVLFDTPGFEDTHKTDTEILEIISKWLVQLYEARVFLCGIIYSHRITDIRMSGAQQRNIKMLAELCGENARHKVVFVTTMWDCETKVIGEQREEGLREFWRPMLDHGANTARFYDTADSAWDIIKDLISRQAEDVALQLQVEIVDLKRQLKETKAARELDMPTMPSTSQ